MAACVYINQGQEQQLGIAKSKLPSLKGVHTIPKLEMNALTIAAKLTMATYEELKKISRIETIYLFTDSEIVLNWLKNNSPAKLLGVLVSNKIKEIKKIVKKFNEEGIKVYFGYISTKLNPADCATRGATAEEFRDHMWWHGPPLSATQEQEKETLRLFELPSGEATVLQIQAQPSLIQWDRFSSLNKLRRTTTFVLKAVEKMSRKLSEATKEAHGKFHRSTAHTMAEVRQKFWIPKLRQQVKKVIKKCVACQRYNNLPFRYPPLAELPKRRVVESRPFQDIGLDLFGPLRTRNAEGIQVKAYGCIFTCATTRLMHIELMRDNSTTSFINAIRRFMSRRGVPNSITCDNAPTFLLAERILTENFQEIEPEDRLESFMANAQITWQKTTPYAPWQGGFYERLIKDVKQALYKSLGRKVVDEDTLRTILTEIEGCLNSRQLTYQEEEDLEDLTPIRLPSEATGGHTPD
ncbi:integrase core domain protein [Oesophagostomum dentatum]|uniref:Integrase core domain protein n=1 Tax=Oesophagostomum dentatum TaxID=61180 RepID=A0A0B1T840_OESDE|nr:integrase core domain protein [Oesophagostomum dentatum]